MHGAMVVPDPGALPPDLSKLKVPELKALCRQHGHAVSGNKAALIARLSATVSSAVRAAPPAASSTSSSTSPSDSDHPQNIALTTATSVTNAATADQASVFSAGTSSTPDTANQATPQSRFSANLPVLLPAKRARLESGLTHTASAQAAESNKLPPPTSSLSTLSAAGSLKVFQPLRPVRNADALVSPADASTSTASTTTPSEASLSALECLTRQYGWILPLLGRDDFQSHLPSGIRDDPLRALAAYLLTRVYCLLGHLDTDVLSDVSWERVPSITAMESILPGIYRCCFEDDTKHTFIGKTGEIISSEDGLRKDWSDLLASSERVQEFFHLMSLVRNQDEDSYEHGISKAFRQQLSKMQDAKAASELLAIAESYVLAHVAPNAISGQWQSLHRQCAEFGGISQSEVSWSRCKQTVSLFLPQVHVVESVSVVGLHEALATVQTLHRAHFVFRLTGQIVGEGDEGVLPLFQALLDCGHRGHPLKALVVRGP